MSEVGVEKVKVCVCACARECVRERAGRVGGRACASMCQPPSPCPTGLQVLAARPSRRRPAPLLRLIAAYCGLLLSWPAAGLLPLRVSQARWVCPYFAAAGSVRVRRGFGVRAWLRAPCAGGSRRQPPKPVAAAQRPLLPTPRRSYRPDEQGVAKRPPRHASVVRSDERADPLRHCRALDPPCVDGVQLQRTGR